jgi:hypothetical protein
MAIETVQLRLNGYLQVDQVSNTSTRAYARTLKRVRLNIVGVPPATDLQLKAVLGGVVQAQLFIWMAGAPSADLPVNGDGLVVPANAGLAFIVVADGGVADLDLEAVFDSATAATAEENPDCGLGVLAVLKAHVLAAALQERTEYDAALSVIGRGVAAAFDRHCGRTFKRAANAIEDFRGGRDVLHLSRYPVESVAGIGLQEIGDANFTEQGDVIENLLRFSGVLWLTCQLGTERAVIRVTSTGGYWYDDSADQTGTLPANATALPADLRLAWLLQCEQVWAQRDNLGVGLTDKPGARAKLEAVELLPAVKEMLQPYVRMALA